MSFDFVPHTGVIRVFDDPLVNFFVVVTEHYSHTSHDTPSVYGTRTQYLLLVLHPSIFLLFLLSRKCLDVHQIIVMNSHPLSFSLSLTLTSDQSLVRSFQKYGMISVT